MMPKQAKSPKLKQLDSTALAGCVEAVDALPPEGLVPPASSQSIEAIRMIHRKREFYLRSEGDLVRRCKSVCRRAAGWRFDDPAAEKKAKEKAADEAYKAALAGSLDGLSADVLPTIADAIAVKDMYRKVVTDAEKMAAKQIKALPIAKFVEETPGFGYVGLMQIIGEAGDLNNYGNPAKLWKRFGLGLISSGERQRKFAEQAKALEAGYSPRRRSLMFVLGDSMLKAKGPYRELYLTRKAYEEQKTPGQTKMVYHRRAQRYMEKRLLRNLWRAWRGQEGDPVAAPL